MKKIDEKIMKAYEKIINEKQENYNDEKKIEKAFEDLDDIAQDILSSTGKAFKYINSMDKKVIKSGPWNSDFKNIISTMVKIEKEIENLYNKVDL